MDRFTRTSAEIKDTKDGVFMCSTAENERIHDKEKATLVSIMDIYFRKRKIGSASCVEKKC